MKPLKIKSKDGPEALIQDALIKLLKGYDWYVKTMFGNLYQSGVPDLYAAHPRFGQKWIEVKNPHSFSFTPAQCSEFPKLLAANVPIWILFAATEQEMAKLFKPANCGLILHGYFHGIRSVKGY